MKGDLGAELLERVDTAPAAELPTITEALQRALMRARARVRAGQIQVRVLAFVLAHPNVSANTVANAVPGSRSEILSALRELQGDGRLNWVPAGWRVGGSRRSEPGGEKASEPPARFHTLGTR